MKHGDSEDIIYYAYANSDFTDLEGTPKPLFIPESRNHCIEGDIIEKDNVDYLYPKTGDDTGSGIKLATSTSLSSNIWTEHEGYLQ